MRETVDSRGGQAGEWRGGGVSEGIAWGRGGRGLWGAGRGT